ncbi:polysaccharide biosynthesis/export family protein [Aureivirga marina]|uniref:polysaccharide biosynthesis/export family protein n=1 Tax=Aureivirga marina TaxID=1182451 RepID=UPI001E5A645C|nr:polysaccharide biosynthesis/export family protein [Aureivirga marina]
MQGDNAVEVSKINFETKFVVDDILTITVSSLDQEAVRPFNLPEPSYNSISGANTALPRQQTYLIHKDGTIDFPVLGKIKLEGLSNEESVSLLQGKLKKYIKDPTVNIRIQNFKVTVLGEVKTPGTFTIPSERITILEALGYAGDMLISGKRKNVLVVRELNNEKKFIRLDLTSEEIVNSEAYYLVQNDVVYVEPNQTKKNSSAFGPSTTVTISLLSTLISLIAILTR